jgi:DNA-binding SARP family transcriptional activator
MLGLEIPATRQDGIRVYAVARELGAEILEAIAGLGEELRTSQLARSRDRAQDGSFASGDDTRLLALEDAYLNLSLQLAEAALAFADYELAHACALRVSSRDPLNGTACELAMRAAAALGDRAAVQVAYRAHSAACREYLDAEPSPQLRTLFASLTA